jgi:tetratricopeptide (TPR) repeat protein
MIAKIRQRQPSTAGPSRNVFLDRFILWSGVLLVVTVAAFGLFYYFDQQASQPAAQQGPRIDLSQYEQVVRDDPNNITNRLALADAYYSLDRYDDAVAQYQAALVINSESALGHVGLGRALIATGDLAGAIESLRPSLTSQGGGYRRYAGADRPLLPGKIALQSSSPMAIAS